MKWEEQKIEFNNMVEELNDLLTNKGREYAGDYDALGNFKAANDLGLTPEQKLGVLMDKHYSSIKSYIKHGKIFSNEPIEGRINDLINYAFLLRCLIKDLKQERENLD
jgi:hypothetical protein